MVSRRSSEFPSKLHYLLQHAETSNQSGERFVVTITKYEEASFQQQLYAFGFRLNDAMSSKNEYGAFYHKLFVRDNYELCHNIYDEDSHYTCVIIAHGSRSNL